MTTNLLIYGQTLRTSLAAISDRLQTRLDGLLTVEDVPVDEPKKGGLPVWVIVLIVVGIVICMIPVCVFLALLLLGPSIGNVFSEIQMNI